MKFCVPPQVFEVVVPKASDIVLAVLTSGYVNASAACLALNVVQSELERSPRFEAEAVGRLNVRVLPEPVMLKSVPVVEEAMMSAPLVSAEPNCGATERTPVFVMVLPVRLSPVENVSGTS